MPSLCGILIFYCIPFIRVLYYSMIQNQFSKKWVGLKNYKILLENQYFRMAVKNSFLLILIGVPILVVSAFIISVLLLKLSKQWQHLRIAFILPMLIPTASIIVIWRVLFLGNETITPIYTLFLWKNIGLIVILCSAAFSLLQPELYEAAKLDGACGIRLHMKITLPMLAPTIFYVTLLGIVDSFRIFRETYLYYGTNYPPDSSYTLQYYMNNHFMKLNYQYLATGAVITTLMICVILVIGIQLQYKFSE